VDQNSGVLIGANGAGKTTTLKGITALQRSNRTTTTTAKTSRKTRVPARLQGLSMVPEGRGVFGALTIEENLAMAPTRVTTMPRSRDIERVFIYSRD
jgi:branched-chain amino acid transport system ATP-binding protein